MVIKTGCNDCSDSSDDSSDDDSEQSYESQPLCSSRKVSINPNDLIRQLKDGNYEFDQNFSQKIEVEVCENEGSPCRDHPLIKTKCRQRFLSIQLQVVSKNSTKSHSKSFRIPSNCECVFYRH
jgi:hypothetical protein